MDAADVGCYELNSRPQISSKSQSCAETVALFSTVLGLFVSGPSSAKNVMSFSAVLRMIAVGFNKDPKLVMRSGISEKKSLQCSFAQPVRISIDVVSSAVAMASLR